MGIRLISIAGLLFARFAHLFPPTWGIVLGIAALSFPFWVLVNVIVWSLYFFKGRGKQKATVGILMALAVFAVLPFFLNSQGKVGKGTPISILSYNLKSFELYDAYEGNPCHRVDIIGSIAKCNADIVCLQEFYTIGDDHYDFKTLDTLSDLLKPKTVFLDSALKSSHRQTFGLAVFSKFKMVKAGKIEMPSQGTNSACFVDLKIANDTVRVIQFHLESINRKNSYSSHAPLHFFEKCTAFFEALKVRMKQVEIMQKLIQHSPYKMIVAGDLNDFDWSYCYRVLNQHLQDSFARVGSGFGFTFPSASPLARIDFVLHSASLNTIYSTVKPGVFSDHLPVYTLLNLPLHE